MTERDHKDPMFTFDLPPSLTLRYLVGVVGLVGLVVLVGAGSCGGGDTAPGTDPSVTIAVDFTSTNFPPLLRKFGYNEEWTEEDAADQAAITAAAAVNAPMIAGLIETKTTSAQGTLASTMSVGGTARLPVFYRDGGGVVQARLDENLASLRSPLKAQGMQNFLQLAGTPEPFIVDSSLTAPPGGNWYPLPLESDFAELGQAFGRLAAVVAADGVPTVFAFWQEPDHTISGNLNRGPSLRKYVHFYRQAALSVKQQDRDFMVAAAQQNSSAGLNGSGAVDGADYLTFVNELLSDEAANGPLPLDVITLQNYKGESSAEILGNARVAYSPDRFNLAPVVMNEFDYGKTGGSITFQEAYDSPDGLIAFLDLLELLSDQSDLDGVMLVRSLAAQTVLASWPLRALGSMSELRRVPSVTGSGGPMVSVLASGDAATAGLIAWNHDTADQSVDLDLRGLSPSLVGQDLVVEVLTTGVPVVLPPVTTTDATVIRGIVLPGHAMLFAHVASLGPQTPSFSQARWSRSLQWCDRQGVSAPTGQGHVDGRTGSLIVGVQDATGVGLAALVLKDVPATGYAPTLALAMSGVTASAVVTVRAEYLAGDATLETIELADPRFSSVAPWQALAQWPNATGAVAITHPSSLDDQAVVTLPIGLDAPAGWASADGGRRRVRLSVLVAGSAVPAIVRATLRD